ncbi:VTT domain-containing protein [Bacillus sp. A116_S68]|nr:VTT domain-containing protein [Bacillus sp. A116_S68]
MKKWAMAILLIALILFIMINWEWIVHLQQEDLSYFTEGVFEEVGYGLLWVTMPLMIVQNVITLFPVLILIIMHFHFFGLIEGFLFSLIGTTLGALTCFWLARSFSSRWVDRFWGRNERRLAYVLRLIASYGVYILVVLRSIPIMPSNLISIAAAVSPLALRPYIWSSFLGNMSMIWLLSLLSAPLWIAENVFMPYLLSYIIFALTVSGYYAGRGILKQE